jgi:hypothetical protein
VRREEAKDNHNFSEMTADRVKNSHDAAVFEFVSSMEIMKESEFPETLSLSFVKISQLRNQFRFIVVSASMLAAIKDAILQTKNPNDLRVSIRPWPASVRKVIMPPQAIPSILDLFLPGSAPELDIRQVISSDSEFVFLNFHGQNFFALRQKTVPV